MKKSILNLGKTLAKKEQKRVLAGRAPLCCLDWDPVARYCYAWQSSC